MGNKNAVERETYAIDLGGVCFTRGSLGLWPGGILVADRGSLSPNERQEPNAIFRPWLRQLGRRFLSSGLTQVTMMEAADQGQLDDLAAVG